MCAVLSHVRLLKKLWTVACQAPLSMGFSKNTEAGYHVLLQGSSQSRDRIYVSCISCIGRQILYHCPTWKAQNESSRAKIKMLAGLFPYGSSREIHSLFLPASRGYLHSLTHGPTSHGLFLLCIHHHIIFYWLISCLFLIWTLVISSYPPGQNNTPIWSLIYSHLQCPFDICCCCC